MMSILNYKEVCRMATSTIEKGIKLSLREKRALAKVLGSETGPSFVSKQSAAETVAQMQRGTKKFLLLAGKKSK